MTIEVARVGLVHSWYNGQFFVLQYRCVLETCSFRFHHDNSTGKTKFLLSSKGSLWVNTQDDKEGVLLTWMCLYCSIVSFSQEHGHANVSNQIIVKHQFHGVKYKVLHTTWMKIINNSRKSMPTSFFDYIFRVVDVAQCMAFFHGLRHHTVLILCTLIGTRNHCDVLTWIRIST